MFGVVPKLLWAKHKVPDDKNRIGMGTNCLLVRTGREVVLIDAGLGDKNDAKFQAIAYEAGARRLPRRWRRSGWAPPTSLTWCCPTCTSTIAAGALASRATAWCRRSPTPGTS